MEFESEKIISNWGELVRKVLGRKYYLSYVLKDLKRYREKCKEVLKNMVAFW